MISFLIFLMVIMNGHLKLIRVMKIISKQRLLFSHARKTFLSCWNNGLMSLNIFNKCIFKLFLMFDSNYFICIAMITISKQRTILVLQSKHSLVLLTQCDSLVLFLSYEFGLSFFM